MSDGTPLRSWGEGREEGGEEVSGGGAKLVVEREERDEQAVAWDDPGPSKGGFSYASLPAPALDVVWPPLLPLLLLFTLLVLQLFTWLLVMPLSGHVAAVTLINTAEAMADNPVWKIVRSVGVS
jgi:hypothetical protein